MDMIDLMPPGLYEAVITEVDEDTANPELIHGKLSVPAWSRARSTTSARSATTTPRTTGASRRSARVSEINHGLYRTLVAARRAGDGDAAESAEMLRQMHPNRLRFALFSDQNPLMAPVKALAETVRADRQPVAPDNPLLALEQVASTWISTTGWRAIAQARDAMTEAMFLGTYGSPLLQAMVGLGAEQRRHRAAHRARPAARGDEAQLRGRARAALRGRRLAARPSCAP